jgi:outer membrane murein-binding lipoprotein Lpp
MADTPDVGTEITPDQFDADEKQDSPKVESSPAKEAEVKEETKAETKPDAEVKEEAKAEPGTKETETEGEPEKTADETETQPQTKADERKTQLNTEIRDLVSQRNALKSEVEKANAEVYQPASEAELTEQGLDATAAKVEALRQRIEMSDYNNKVADAQLTISSESERVLNDFPLFNPDSKDYDEELANEAAELLKANLIYDPNTEQIIGSNVSTYQLYKTLARASGISATKGQLKGQQDTEKMLANADTGSSTAPEAKAKDPTGLEVLWDADADF